MKLTVVLRFSSYAFLALVGLVLVCQAAGQQLAKRLILTDGSYQLATKWEVHGDRVRYFSAERAEWEEVPKSMVDWAATEKYEKDLAAGVPPIGARDLDKELAADRAAEEARSPQVAPGLHLPSDGGVFLLDNFQNRPQLVELFQSTSEINQNRTGNILRATINPIASAKQSIELPGLHAKIQAHALLPAVYVRIDPEDTSANAASTPENAWDRFRIVRLQAKQNKRIVGDIKVAIYGKVSQEQKLVPSSAERLKGDWVKVTPSEPLAPGEYAVIEMLGKEGINTYVWDFGVNPSAPANAAALTPDAPVEPPPANQTPQLQKHP